MCILFENTQQDLDNGQSELSNLIGQFTGSLFYLYEPPRSTYETGIMRRNSIGQLKVHIT